MIMDNSANQTTKSEPTIRYKIVHKHTREAIGWAYIIEHSKCSSRNLDDFELVNFSADESILLDNNNDGRQQSNERPQNLVEDLEISSSSDDDGSSFNITTENISSPIPDNHTHISSSSNFNEKIKESMYPTSVCVDLSSKIDVSNEKNGLDANISNKKNKEYSKALSVGKSMVSEILEDIKSEFKVQNDIKPNENSKERSEKRRKRVVESQQNTSNKKIDSYLFFKADPNDKNVDKSKRKGTCSLCNDGKLIGRKSFGPHILSFHEEDWICPNCKEKVRAKNVVSHRKKCLASE